MTNFIPIFPLGIVVYPGENLNLHIFEPQYKQLISECHASEKPFGIPTVIENKVQDYGSLVEITEMTKIYDNGEMDIRTRGQRVFRILEVIREVPEKLYSGAIVNYPETYEKGNPDVMRRVMKSIRDLHRLLNLKKDFEKKDTELRCFDVAHHVGLSLEEEYELLRLLDERQRQEYLKRHLKRMIPIIAGLETMKEKIRMNGHFRDLKGFDLGT